MRMKLSLTLFLAYFIFGFVASLGGITYKDWELYGLMLCIAVVQFLTLLGHKD